MKEVDVVAVRNAVSQSSAIRVGPAMHRGVIACTPDCSGLNIARTMAAHRIHCVVLAPPGAPPRFVTDFEIVRALHDGTLATSCADELAREAPVVARDDTIAHAAEALYGHRTTHAVVVSDLRSLRPVGVLSVLDIAEALVAKEDN